jgi:hypothetical protein
LHLLAFIYCFSNIWATRNKIKSNLKAQKPAPAAST